MVRWLGHEYWSHLHVKADIGRTTCPLWTSAHELHRTQDPTNQPQFSVCLSVCHTRGNSQRLRRHVRHSVGVLSLFGINDHYRFSFNYHQIKRHINTCCIRFSRPPLWSSGQSSWLQIRKPGFDSRHYQKKNCSGSGTGSTLTREYNWGATW
jgi:ribosomal protein L37E